MQLRCDDLALHAFTPSDGSESAAIKVIHRPSGKEAVNNSTNCQRANLRGAVLDLLQAMNPSPDQIRAPSIVLFDDVRVNLPESIHEGRVIDLTWDYTTSEWKYFVECPQSKVTNWYVAADLDVVEE